MRPLGPAVYVLFPKVSWGENLRKLFLYSLSPHCTLTLSTFIMSTFNKNNQHYSAERREFILIYTGWVFCANNIMWRRWSRSLGPRYMYEVRFTSDAITFLPASGCGNIYHTAHFIAFTNTKSEKNINKNVSHTNLCYSLPEEWCSTGSWSNKTDICFIAPS